MQRKSTKQSPGANTAERRFIAYTKARACICCKAVDVQVDHLYGSSNKKRVGFSKMQNGHFAIIPLCVICHDIKTRAPNDFISQHGEFPLVWLEHAMSYGLDKIPLSIVISMLNHLEGRERQTFEAMIVEWEAEHG